METKEDGEERYLGRAGEGRQKERYAWWEVAGGGGGSTSGRSGLFARARKDPSLGGGGQLLPAARGSCPSPALWCAAPRQPSRGSWSPGRAVPHPGPPGRPPPRPPASSPSGPEGATGQRSPESWPGWVGGGAVLPRASCARGSAAPARAVAPSATARLRGGRAGAPGGSRAPRGVRGGLQA